MKQQKNNKGYLGNPNLKKSGDHVEFSQHDIDEYAKCMIDPIYFITNYIKIVTLDNGEQPFNLFEYQKKFITSIHENRMSLGLFPRQHGKCLTNNTKVKIKQKSSGIIYSLSLGEFYEWQKFKQFGKPEDLLQMRGEFHTIVQKQNSM